MGKDAAVPERSTLTAEPPSSRQQRWADVGPGTIAMALAAFSMALFSYLF
jgi:hypothetical protein